MSQEYRANRLFACLFLLLAKVVLTQAVIAQDPRAEWAALNQQVINVYQEGRYADGIILAKQDLQFTRTAFGNEYSNTLISMNNLTGLHERQGRYGEADLLYEQVRANPRNGNSKKTLKSCRSRCLVIEPTSSSPVGG